ncbi:MAG: helix-turn-helix transcriptional regulator [Clostridia bacterium]|nr:helix-turn-helix transcriptional regulator [Clostridia bacterium]MBP3464321.1 helix-turn-helix transcriptional regulator [Clostridia bacterium]
MDQVKIGKFIAQCRKNKKLTQVQLAEKLNITDRAISKWETGNGMPDSSVMLDLCEILGISVNELLSGEVIKMENYDLKAEENLIELKKQKEDSDRNMLSLELVIGYISSISFLVLVFVASFLEMPSMIRVLLIILGGIIFAIGVTNAIKIEQIAGYYECNKCHYKYIPSYNKVLFSMHYGRTRYMKCPKCNSRSWNKKILTK